MQDLKELVGNYLKSNLNADVLVTTDVTEQGESLYIMAPGVIARYTYDEDGDFIGNAVTTSGVLRFDEYVEVYPCNLIPEHWGAGCVVQHFLNILDEYDLINP